MFRSRYPTKGRRTPRALKGKFRQNKTYMPMRSMGTIFPQKLDVVLLSNCTKVVDGALTITDYSTNLLFGEIDAGYLNSCWNPFRVSTTATTPPIYNQPQYWSTMIDLYDRYMVVWTEIILEVVNNNASDDLEVVLWTPGTGNSSFGSSWNYVVNQPYIKKMYIQNALCDKHIGRVRRWVPIKPQIPLVAFQNQYAGTQSDPGAKAEWIVLVQNLNAAATVDVILRYTMRQRILLANSNQIPGYVEPAPEAEEMKMDVPEETSMIQPSTKENKIKMMLKKKE